MLTIGNIVPIMQIEPSSLAFWASVLPLHHVGSLVSWSLDEMRSPRILQG